MESTDGVNLSWVNNVGQFVVPSISDGSGAYIWGAGTYGFALRSASPIGWSSTTGYYGALDTAIFRSSAGNLRVTGGTSGTTGGLTTGTLTAVALATPTITSVTPSANNAISCSYKLVAYAGDGTSTAASAAVATAVGPTNCNSMTVVWTAASNVTAYALERTGGPSNGMITAMAFPAWLNNTTNCPGGTCTYIDLGVAASGAAPTANTTGQIVTKIATPAAAADACTAGAIWSDASYIYSCTSSGAIKRGAIAAW